MKEMDCVEVTIEKEKYAQDGVHKGMQGWICDPYFVNGTWLVNFPQCGEKDDIAEISIKEEDLKLVPIMYAIVNEQIKAQFEESGERKSAMPSEDSVGNSEDISDYLV